MLHNIFSKKSGKEIQKQNPKIIIDIHEKNSLVISELKSSGQIDIEIKSLKIGDYLVGNTIIERKTVSDFISSMLNRRLIEQLRQMQEYKNNLLIIEGEISSFFKERTNINPNSVRGFIISILTNYKIPIIFTKDSEDTSQYLITLAKQQLKPKKEISLHSRIPKTIKEQKKYIIESFPNIGPATAKKLLEKFKTISNIINADEKELKEILMGKTENFQKLIKE